MKSTYNERAPRVAATTPEAQNGSSQNRIKSTRGGRGRQEVEDLKRQLAAVEEEAAHYKAEWKAARLEADELEGDVREYRGELLEALNWPVEWEAIRAHGYKGAI
ncbi:MAG: hypothetical protein ACE5JP_16360 [Candidatus Bipolaricaulia bacterium]